MTSREDKFNRLLISEYLKYGSVDEVFRKNKFDLPISYANYQRVLDKWGIVKAAGSQSKLSESVDFLYRLAQEKIPFDTLYNNMPPSFRTSAVTLYRILGYVKEGITRRVGTGLILTPYGNRKKILIAKDISIPRVDLGKPYGSLTIPMGFSRKRDLREEAILRILQSELFTDFAINKKMPKVIANNPKPFMYLDIADVRVEIFEIKLPRKWSNTKNFSSFKLENYKYRDINEVVGDKKLRIGIKEVIRGYVKYLDYQKRNLSFNPLQYRSSLNYRLAELPDEQIL